MAEEILSETDMVALQRALATRKPADLAETIFSIDVLMSHLKNLLLEDSKDGSTSDLPNMVRGLLPVFFHFFIIVMLLGLFSRPNVFDSRKTFHI